MDYKFTKSIVAFIDILGFQNLVDKTTNKLEEKTISNLDTALKTGFESAKKSFLNKECKECKVSMFSDCICFSCPYIYSSASEVEIEDGLSSFLLSVLFSLTQLTKIGLMVRGGITIGNHFQNERLIFSPALIKAYKLESTQAIYPRILIDDSFIIEINKHFPNVPSHSESEYVLDWFRKDTDGKIFLNYLPDEIILASRRDLITWNKNMIKNTFENNKNKFNIIEKCRWSANFHNQRIEEFINIYGKSKRNLALRDHKIDIKNLFISFENL